jgi:hypothetical protein
MMIDPAISFRVSFIMSRYALMLICADGAAQQQQKQENKRGTNELNL